MGVDAKSLSRKQRWLIPLLFTVLCVYNQVMSVVIAPPMYGRLLFLNMHLPMFFLYLYIAGRGIIKTAFMILTALVFSVPSTIFEKLLSQFLFANTPILMLSRLTSYILLLLLAQFVFRNGFNYLLQYGSNQFFLLFSMVPVVYYVYVFAYMNLDISSITSLAGFLVRLLPNLEVFVFYFLLPYIYKTLSEKHTVESAQLSLQQKLSATEDQIALLNEANMRMAVYRHDMRHQLTMLDGLLAGGNTEQAKAFVQSVIADLGAITPKQFCENETVNLLCSSYDSKAQRLGVRLTVKALLPKQLPLSDTELCSVVSNGLENALQAASQPELTEKWVEFYCEARQNKILIQIQNPYTGNVIMRNGLPVSTQEGHGYGCHSIQTIVQRNGGLCSFTAENGLFSLRLAIPIKTDCGD